MQIDWPTKGKGLAEEDENGSGDNRYNLFAYLAYDHNGEIKSKQLIPTLLGRVFDDDNDNDDDQSNSVNHFNHEICTPE